MIADEKIGLGGGCHWCTEAVFQSLKGVISVDQGYLASTDEFSSFSEGIIVTYDPDTINISLLIEIHLLTHKSTKNHSMRSKYRSAIYTFSEQQNTEVNQILTTLNKERDGALITLVLEFLKFKPSREEITNYYFNNPKKPFCESFINPKLILLLRNYANAIKQDKLDHLKKEITA
ncbi:peptide-methionine (S)-S-oxide reductase [uncultured Psychroserpens sp.]|uniref:peptide-methionine (S)-S-oxide reductase n=1 Tax=uncultured Psychroserpens sp. TaxID=255436 RepID=UPI00262FDE86|nr:peptide-methionine (S)-S-oxide reductase [uncultured Psychroserpens sp.]